MSRLDTIFCCAFAFSILFPMKAPTYCLELYGVYALFHFFQGKNFPRLKIPSTFAFLLIYFLTNLASILLSEEKSGTWPQIEKRLSFILIPMLLLIRKEYITEYTIRKTFHFFILGCIASSIIDFIRALYRSIQIIDSQLKFDAAVIEGKSFFDSIVYGGNYFFYEDYSWFMHPTYFSFYLLFSICILLYYLYYDKLTRKKTLVIILLITWFLLNIYLLSSRAILLSAMLVSSFWIFWFLRSLSPRKIIYLGVFLTTIATVILVSNPRITFLFRGEEFFDNNQRFQIWKAGAIVIKCNFPWGTGVLDLYSDMEQACTSIGFADGAELKYNLHNQYLETLAGTGILGLLALLAVLLSLLKEGIKQSNHLLIHLLLIVSFNFLFESMFNVYSGIVFICFWGSLLTNFSQRETMAVTNEDG